MPSLSPIKALGFRSPNYFKTFNQLTRGVPPITILVASYCTSVLSTSAMGTCPYTPTTKALTLFICIYISILNLPSISLR